MMSLTKAKAVAKNPTAYDVEELHDALTTILDSDRLTEQQVANLQAKIDPVMRCRMPGITPIGGEAIDNPRQRCLRCDYDRPVALFRAATGWRTTCSICIKDQHRDAMLWRTYGIGLATYERMRREQAFCCAICCKHCPDFWGANSLHVDHDHVTGKVRGLLCKQCNAGLGMFGDSARVIEWAIAYLNAAQQ